MGLIYKLIKSGLPDSIIRLIESYFKGRYYQVKEGSVLPQIHPINAGVPHESVLGPLLCNIFTSDIPTTVQTYVAQYADGSALFSIDRPNSGCKKLTSSY